MEITSGIWWSDWNEDSVDVGWDLGFSISNKFSVDCDFVDHTLNSKACITLYSYYKSNILNFYSCP